MDVEARCHAGALNTTRDPKRDDPLTNIRFGSISIHRCLRGVIEPSGLESDRRGEAAGGVASKTGGLWLGTSFGQAANRVLPRQQSARGGPRHNQLRLPGLYALPSEGINPKKQVFTNFTPAMSAKALKRIMAEVRGLKLQRPAGSTVREIARWLNPGVGSLRTSDTSAGICWVD